MVTINNPFDELQRKLDQAKRNYERLQEFVKQGVISERLGEYASHLLVLNHLSDESEVYARLGDIEKAGHSLAQMKHQLDGVAGILLANGRMQTRKIGKGLSVIENPNFDNLSKYQALYDFARSRFDDAVTRCEEILEGRAA